MRIALFLDWLATAPADARAEAAASLAHAFLWSNLGEEDCDTATTAMTLLLDDPSLAVRRTLAETLAPDSRAPSHVVQALARDAADVAVPVLALSPLLGDIDLVDLAALHGEAGQIAIASRAFVPATVAGALAAVGSPAACAVLVENAGAMLTASVLGRIVQAHGADPTVREPLMARPDLPPALRQLLLVKLADALTGLVVGHSWLSRDRAERAAREACDRGTLTIAATTAPGAVAPLVRHLRQSRQLTPTLLLRAALSGQDGLVDEALAQLSGLPLDRVRAITSVGSAAGIAALVRRAGLPAPTQAAFAEALRRRRRDGGGARLDRALIEDVLEAHGATAPAALDPLAALLRRFAVEAAREDALERAQDRLEVQRSAA